MLLLQIVHIIDLHTKNVVVRIVLGMSLVFFVYQIDTLVNNLYSVGLLSNTTILFTPTNYY